MQSPLEGFTLLVEETTPVEAVRVRDLLEAAGIPSKVKGTEEPAPSADETPELRSVWVPRNLAARAKTVLQIT